VPEVPGFEVTAQMALVRRRDRTLDCSTRVRTKLIMHRVVTKPTHESANGSKRQGRKSLRFFENSQSRHVGP
jgi:hypothetical protein